MALLRGVNVGGRNRLRMADLVAHFEASGAREVATLLQSGNVVFSAPEARAASIARAVEAAIREQQGFEAPVVVRSAADYLAATHTHLLADGASEDELHIAFLADTPTAARVRALDAERGTPDRFLVAGREVHLRLVGGGARTRLSVAWFDRALATTATQRNWRTVCALAGLLEN